MIHVYADNWPEYALLDSGHCKKLERFGEMLVVREEPKAWWAPELPETEWNKATAYHAGDDAGAWKFYRSVAQEWRLHFEELTVEARFTATSKHVGVFPEQAAHWHWIAEQIRAAGRRELRVLNLFAYTGMATLVAAAHGATVTHVDSAKGVVAWGKHNQQLSGLQNRPIRWIVDDAAKFVKREVRRERQYDMILLDPPSFGRGPKRELWKIEQHLVDLLTDCRQILSEAPVGVLLTMYSLDQSALMTANLLQDMLRGFGGKIDVGELTLQPKTPGKVLPMSIFGRWVSS